MNEMNLPAACALHQMSPLERQVHLRRLERLGKAGVLTAVYEDGSGFEFAVDLKIMSLEALSLWMKAEQVCCSFLTLTMEKIEFGDRARVVVICSEHVRDEMIRTFGLQQNK